MGAKERRTRCEGECRCPYRPGQIDSRCGAQDYLPLSNRPSPPNAHSPQPTAFPFLNLPPELRAMIYHHALTATPIVTFYALPRKWQPISLLRASHLIHSETFTHLYTSATFVIDIYPCSITTPMQTPPRSHSRLAITQPHFATLARTIELRIHWADPDWLDEDTLPPALQEASASRKIRHTLRGAIDTLVHFASLHRVIVTWSAPPAGIQSAVAAAAAAKGPSKAKIPVLLRPLKVLREARPGVVILMPAGGAVSSEELAKGQEGPRVGPAMSAAACEALKEVKEGVEDAVEGCEEVRKALLKEGKRAILGLG